MNKIFDFTTLYFADDSADTPADNKPTNTPPAPDKSDKDSGKDDKKYSDADVDKLLEKKFAKWQKQKEAEINEAKKLADMTATERAEHERDKLKAELEELKAANTRAEMEKTARSILQADGVTVDDKIISHLVAADADTTSANVKAFSKAFKAAVQAEVKNQLSHKSPSAGTPGGGLTKDAIMKEPDAIKRQQLIRDNISLFR